MGWGYGEEVHDRYLFGGSTHQPLFGRKVAHFYEAPQLDVVKDLKRIAENKARAALGLPGIGEGSARGDPAVPHHRAGVSRNPSGPAWAPRLAGAAAFRCLDASLAGGPGVPRTPTLRTGRVLRRALWIRSHGSTRPIESREGVEPRGITDLRAGRRRRRQSAGRDKGSSTSRAAGNICISGQARHRVLTVGHSESPLRIPGVLAGTGCATSGGYPRPVRITLLSSSRRPASAGPRGVDSGPARTCDRFPRGLASHLPTYC